MQARVLWVLKPLVLLLLTASGSAPTLSAGNPHSPEERIDQIFKEWNTRHSPGASVAVIKNGRVLFEKGYGMANLEYGIPIKPDTIFHVASVSKQFTAMAVLLLEADGKLSIDDDVHKYLPELPDYGSRITLRNLLQHTSGIRDQWQLLGMAGWNLQDVITQDQILRLLFRQKALNFPPGTRNLYSNGGFTLLAEIVARVSHESFPQFCAERIFAPLGMTHTHFHQDLTQLVPGRAYSYAAEGSDFFLAPLNYANVGATSLFTTSPDLLEWLDNFRTSKVGGAAVIARMQEPTILADGKKIDYGLGLELGRHRGLRLISHSGGDAGYRSEVMWFPEQQLGVAVVSNLASFDPRQAAFDVTSVYIGDRMAPEKTAPSRAKRNYIEIDAKELEKFAGTYPLQKFQQALHVMVDGGRLMARPRFELRPLGPAHFYIEDLQADVEFQSHDDGTMSVRITQPGGAVNEGVRSAAEDDFHPYTGEYWSDEVESQYTFFVRDSALFGLNNHYGEFLLQPAGKDQFSSNAWFTPHLEFVRNSENQIMGVTLGGGRVTAVMLTRKPGGMIEKPPFPVASVSAEALQPIVGRYDYRGPVLTVTREADRAFAQVGLQPKDEIFPKSASEFFWKLTDAQVRFVTDRSGHVVSAVHTQNGRTFTASRMPDLTDVKLTAAQTNAALGEYDSAASRRLTISREADRLYSRVTGGARVELAALSETVFCARNFNIRLTFRKDKAGRVTSVLLQQDGGDTEWQKVKSNVEQ